VYDVGNTHRRVIRTGGTVKRRDQRPWLPRARFASVRHDAGGQSYEDNKTQLDRCRKVW